MVDQNTGSDDPVIRTFERIIISGVRHEVILTEKRLLIREAGTGTVRRDAEYSRIVLANLGVNTLREPEVSLSFAGAGGEIGTEDLIFVHLPGGQNVQEADRCMDILKEHNVPIRRTTTGAQMGPPSRAESFMPSQRDDRGRPDVPDFSRFGSSGSNRPQEVVPAGGPRGILSSPFVIAGLVIAILIVIAAIVSVGGLAGAPEAPPVTTAPLPAATTIPVTTPPVPVPQETTVQVPQATPAPVTIPKNGIWMAIVSQSTYVGDIKAGSWTDTINTTGTYIIQIATQDTLIEGSVEKTDGSGTALDVKIYNGGEEIYAASTTKPYGTIEIRQRVGPAIVRNPVGTPTPTPVVSLLPTPDPLIASREVPAYGTFVRVTYNGNFTGSINAISYERPVDSSGDQIYQVPVKEGEQIDGFLEKADGSNRNLVVGIYNRGTLIATANTTKPYGNVDIHTTI